METKRHEHIPVLYNEIEKYYSVLPSKKTIIDATVGLGGHTKLLYTGMQNGGVLLGFDRDSDNLKIAKDLLHPIFEDNKKLIFIHESFDKVSEILDNYGFENVDFALYDLGVSSAHYDDGDRGFSFRFDAPLDMRFDRTKGETARDILAKKSSRELFHIFRDYGEEKKAFFIAEKIVETRENRPILTTGDLVTLIEGVSFDKKSTMRVFQALRIAVNNEFEHIKKSLDRLSKKMNIGGQIAVITFHSLEDRIVKNFFQELTSAPKNEITGHDIYPPAFMKVTKKPIEPTSEECSNNPRSRSAKLRIIQKIH